MKYTPGTTATGTLLLAGLALLLISTPAVAQPVHPLSAAQVDCAAGQLRAILGRSAILFGPAYDDRSAMFLFSATMKLVGGPALETGMEHLGLPMSIVVPLAILEISCVVVYLIPRTAVLGAVLQAGYLGGAICTHWRVGDNFLLHIGLGLTLWLALWLREPRLHALLPLRRGG